MTRIVIMADNKVGVIADISRALADANINIETISAEALGDKGTITLTTNDYDGALTVLTEAGFKNMTDEALILSVRDEPGVLAKVAGSLKDGGVNIESLHIIDRREGRAVIAITADDPEKAESLLDRSTIV